jgi:hypothetical protein
MPAPRWIERELLFSPQHEVNQWIAQYYETGLVYGFKRGLPDQETANEHYIGAANMAVRVTVVVLWNLHQIHNQPGDTHDG